MSRKGHEDETITKRMGGRREVRDGERTKEGVQSSLLPALAHERLGCHPNGKIKSSCSVVDLRRNARQQALSVKRVEANDATKGEASPALSVTVDQDAKQVM
jgi:hypothetical protein